MKTELKPCPFCGSPLHVTNTFEKFAGLPKEWIVIDRSRVWNVECETSDCIFGRRLEFYLDKEELIKRLNRRDGI